MYPVSGTRLCQSIDGTEPARFERCDVGVLLEYPAEFVDSFQQTGFRERVHRELYFGAVGKVEGLAMPDPLYLRVFRQGEELRVNSGGTTIGSSEFFSELPLKISAKEVLITARKPNWVSAQGACSRELPQPKLSPASRICAPLPRGVFRMKSGFGLPSAS